MDEAFEALTWEEIRAEAEARGLTPEQMKRLEALFRLHESLKGDESPEEREKIMARIEGEVRAAKG